MKFVQTTSIVRRFRMMTVGLGLFLILEFIGFFISSQTTLTGLRDLSRLNALTDLASRGVLNLSSALETLEKGISSRRTTHKQLEPVYAAAESEASEAIAAALELNPLSSQTRRLFSDAQNSVRELNRAAQKIFANLPARKPRQQMLVRKQFLLIKQFELDATESLRSAQIELSQSNNEIFLNVYRGRLTPLVFSLALALVFFGFALWFGFRTTRRLNLSLNNLLDATDEVASGNLSTRVSVLANDEIGRLTSAFDTMVQNLDQSLKNSKTTGERIARLQGITAEFSRALDPQGVGNAVVLQGVAELSASAGAVVSLSENSETMHVLSSVGFADELLEKWKEFPLSADIPVTESVRQKKSFFLESTLDIKARFSSANAPDAYLPQAMIAVPLVVNNAAIGSLTFTFDQPRKFSSEERDFVIALAELASQAFQRARLYDSAQKAIHIRDEFLSIASHELKTPITSLKLQLQIGQRQTNAKENKAPSPEKLARLFEVSVSQVERLTSLVEDLLDVTRISAGKLSYEFIPFDLTATLQDILERFDGILKSANCPAELLRADPVTIRGDKFRVEQVIVNLLSNAMKYGNGQPIQISLRREGNRAQLSVQDHGIGIPVEKQAIIFGRFERVSNTQNIGGLGLGLYITRQIVEAHEGTIGVESTLGQGSRFTVEFPVVS